MIVQNKGVFIRHVGEVMLIPGANELDEASTKRFNDALTNPLNKALIDKELFIIGSEKGGNSGGITDINAEESLLLIEDTFDLELLAKWLDEEKAKKSRARKSVVKSIEDRVDYIQNPPADDLANTGGIENSEA